MPLISKSTSPKRDAAIGKTAVVVRNTENAAVAAAADSRPCQPEKPSSYYRKHYPRWAVLSRRYLHNAIRNEEPYLSGMQKRLRSPLLDAYFVWTSNLGSHMFFVLMLPLVTWFGDGMYGRGLCWVNSLAVILSSMVKDFLCLPRPASPPLIRLTMSPYHKLEYGFVSTHSANATAMVLYLLPAVICHDRTTAAVLFLAASAYHFTICFGRLYCGMHSLTDVTGGMVIGAVSWLTYWLAEDVLERATVSGGWEVPVLMLACSIAILLCFPEPVEKCPCLEDAACFVGATAGMNVGSWAFIATPYSMDFPSKGTVYDPRSANLLVSVAKMIFGVSIIFLWRMVMKRTCFLILPPVYRALRATRRFDSPTRNFPCWGVREYACFPAAEPISVVSSVLLDLPNNHPKESSAGSSMSRSCAYEWLKERYRTLSHKRTGHWRVARRLPSPKHSRQGGNEKRDFPAKMTDDEEEKEEAGEKDAAGVLRTMLSPENKIIIANCTSKQQTLPHNPPSPSRDVDNNIAVKFVVYAGVGFLSTCGIPVMFAHLDRMLGLRRY